MRATSRSTRSSSGLAAGLDKLLGDDAKAVELLGGVVNSGVLERLSSVERPDPSQSARGR